MTGAGRWDLAAAAGLAIAAQWLVDVDHGRWGLVLYAGVAALVLGRRGDGVAPWFPAPATVEPTPLPRWTQVTLLVILAAAAVTASVFDVREPPVGFWLLHVATAIAAVAVTLVGARRRPAPGPTRSGDEPGPYPAADPDPDPDAEPAVVGDARRWRILLALVVVAGFALRLVDLGSLPEGLWIDEADHIAVAQRIVDEPGYLPLWVEGIYASPAHHSHMVAVLLWLGVDPVWSLRLVSVGLGMAMAAGAYLVGRRFWGPVGAIAAVALVALTRWPVTMSRIGLFNVATPAFLLLGLAFATSGAARDRPVRRLLGGVFLGLGVGFHSSMLPGIAGVALVLLASEGWSPRRAVRQFAITGVGFAIAAAPIIGIAVREPDLYLERQREVSLFGQEGVDVASELADNTVAVFGSFHVRGDANGRHNLPHEPLLDPISGGLCAVGLLLALRRTGRSLRLPLLGWGVLALVPGITTLSFEVPNAIRIVAVAPVVFLLGTGAVVAVLANRSARVQTTVLLVLVGGLTAQTVKEYFVDWRDDVDVWRAHSIIETLGARAVADEPSSTEVVAVGEIVLNPINLVLAPGVIDDDLAIDDVYPLALSGDADVVVLGAGRNEALVREVVARLPDATVTEYGREGVVAVREVRIPAASVRAMQGLTASYRSGSAEDPPVAIVDERTPGATAATLEVRPATVTWQGLLLVDRAGMHRLEAPGATITSLRVDGAPVDPGAATLAFGPHHVEIDAIVDDPDALALAWQRPDDDAAGVIEPRWLWRTPDGPHGLYSTASGDDGAISRSRLDPAIDIVVGDPGASRPREVRWTGFIEITEPGDHRFSLEATGSRSLSIDGRQIIGDGVTEPVTVDLAAGPHTIEVMMVDGGGGHEIRLRWARGDEPLGPVPSSVLRPPWWGGGSPPAS